MMWMDSGRSSGLASITLLLPQQKIAEDRLALLLGQIGKGRAFVLEECRKFGAGRLLGHDLFLPQPTQHLLRNTGPGPSRHGGGEVYVAPFGMPRRLAKFPPFIEKRLREPFNPGGSDHCPGASCRPPVPQELQGSPLDGPQEPGRDILCSSARSLHSSRRRPWRKESKESAGPSSEVSAQRSGSAVRVTAP